MGKSGAVERDGLKRWKYFQQSKKKRRFNGNCTAEGTLGTYYRGGKSIAERGKKEKSLRR